MRYLSYDEYLELGGTLDATAFNRYLPRACAFLDTQTFNRLREQSQVVTFKTEPIKYGDLENGIEFESPIATLINVSENVKACVRDLVDYLANNVSSGKAITSKSQSVGGVSESESYSTKASDEALADMTDIVYDYLAPEVDEKGTPLLYKGAMI